MTAAEDEEVRVLESFTFNGAEETNDQPCMTNDDYDIIEEVVSDVTQATLPFAIGANDFVTWFATTNVFRVKGASDLDRTIASRREPSWHSRLEPTPFMYYCGIGQCEYQTWQIRSIKGHCVACKGLLPPAERPFICQEPDCHQSYVSEKRLSAHVNRIHRHTGYPRPCQECEEDNETLYNTFLELQRHRYHVHDMFQVAQRYPLRESEACNRPDELFSRRELLLSHLRGPHGLSK